MQEPQGAETIDGCMKTRFSLGFDLLQKVSVNGPSTHPIFRWLRLRGAASNGSDGGGDADAISWNFNIFLVHRSGEAADRYPNSATPLSLIEDIETLLDADAPSPPQADTKPGRDDEAGMDSPALIMARTLT